MGTPDTRYGEMAENVNKVTKFMFLNRRNEIFRVKKPTHTRWPRGQVNLLLGAVTAHGGGTRKIALMEK